MYEYKATLIRVVDGDTVWLRVDLGFRTFIESDFRLYGINAPEKTGPNAQPVAAKAAQDYLTSLIVGKSLFIESKGPDKYGRWLATILLPDGTDVNTAMILSGNAVKYP